MYRYNQHSFVGGQLDRGLMGRQDLERYFQGASKLENFLVRKQGNITKRRGTETMADLQDLFGTGDAIAYSRIIPFSQDITAGFYLLFAESAAGESGAFVIGDSGLLHSKTVTKSLEGRDDVVSSSQEWLRSCARSTEETTEEIAAEDGTAETWSVSTVIEPFRIDIPYTGQEFDEIGFNQSGDTVFLTHKNHPPAKVVFAGATFKYSSIDFAFNMWKRPAIVSVSKTGVDSGISGAVSRTVSYVCTYVKNGVESMPSEPFAVTYQSPWKSGGIITITCSRGDNETEPDYYNIYKKDFTEYGLIYTIGAPQDVSPDVSAAAISGTMSSQNKAELTYKQVNVSKPKTVTRTRAGWGVGRFLNVIYSSLDSGEDMLYENDGYGIVACLPLIGGMKSPGGVRFNFGSNSGSIVTRIELQLDNYSGYTYSSGWSDYQKPQYIRHHVFGRRFQVKITAKQNSDPDAASQPTAKVFTKTVSVAMPTGVSSTAHSGQYDTDSGLIVQNWRRDMASWDKVYSFSDAAQKRMLDVSFETELVNAFKSESWSNSGKQGYHVESIEVTAIDDSGNVVSGDFLFCGVKFYSTIASSKIVQDEYITPNIAFTPPQASDNFTKTGDYPSCVALYTQRLAFAATQNQPFTWWMSCVGDLYNFSTHAAIRHDDAMEVTVPATEFPNINHMVLSRDLVLFCDNGEWLVRPLSGNTLAYDTVECKKQSAIGCAKGVPPLQVGDEIIFADNSRRTIRSIKYQFTSDGYESSDLSILSQSLFFSNPVVSMCYKQHPESLVLCELADGTVAALVYMKEHNVVAWTHHTLGGGWKCRGIASNKAHANETTHVAMLVEHPDGGTEVWRVRDDDESGDLSMQLCMDGLRFATGADIGEAAFAENSGQAVIDLKTGERVASHADIAADGEYAVGYPFTSTFLSVRPEPQGAETFQWELKNAKLVHLRTLNGSSFSIKDAGMGDDYASTVEIGRTVEDGKITIPGLVDATDILLNGENSRDGRIEVNHDGILPLTIESFSVDYETQPLYGSEG